MTGRITVLAFILLAVLCLIMGGCDCRFSQPGPVPAPGPGADLVAMGRIFLWCGGIAAVAGVALRVALFFGVANPLVAVVSRIPGIAGLASLVAEVGAIALVSGLVFVWMGQHLWVVVLALVLTCLAWAWYRRALLRRWFLSRAQALEVIK